MSELTHPIRRRLACLVGAGVLLAGGFGGAALIAPGPADAAACGPAVPAGTSCTMTGSFVLSGGSLTLTSPIALGWAGTLSSLDLNLVDPTTAHQSYLVNDATGGGAGWHVTLSATTFTTGSITLGNTGTFSTNGSVASLAATTAPTAACTSGSTCTLPTDTTSYPVAITTAPTTPTAFTIYDTSAATGLGSIVIGFPGANAVGWWLNVPANTKAGTYASTVTMQVVSAP